MRVSELQEYIVKRCNELNISMRGLARETGISRDSLRKIINGETKQAQLSTIVTLAHALKVHPFHLFRYVFSQTEIPKYTSTEANYRHDATGFIGDMTYPDNSIVRADETFIKIWAIQNIGSIDWTGRELVCMDAQPEGNFALPEKIEMPMAFRGLKPSVRRVAIPSTPAGEMVEIAVEFTAPSYPCSVISYWKMVDENGDFCFPKSEGLSCVVQVLAV